MGGTSTISGGKLYLRIDPRLATLSGCAASRGPTIKANTVPFIMDNDDYPQSWEKRCGTACCEPHRWAGV
jgi:hypothetical protein